MRKTMVFLGGVLVGLLLSVGAIVVLVSLVNGLPH
jgi:hypothetical protein